jgi:hypothetical protein
MKHDAWSPVSSVSVMGCAALAYHGHGSFDAAYPASLHGYDAPLLNAIMTPACWRRPYSPHQQSGRSAWASSNDQAREILSRLIIRACSTWLPST